MPSVKNSASWFSSVAISTTGSGELAAAKASRFASAGDCAHRDANDDDEEEVEDEEKRRMRSGSRSPFLAVLTNEEDEDDGSGGTALFNPLPAVAACDTTDNGTARRVAVIGVAASAAVAPPRENAWSGPPAPVSAL